jgi:hypothetical protein
MPQLEHCINTNGAVGVSMLSMRTVEGKAGSKQALPRAERTCYPGVHHDNQCLGVPLIPSLTWRHLLHGINFSNHTTPPVLTMLEGSEHASMTALLTSP